MTNEPPLVLITGVTGYLASVVVAFTLAAGFRVRGTVRKIPADPTTDPKTEALFRLTGPQAPLELFEATLEDESCWNEAVKGVTYILHIASPVPKEHPKDPEKEMIQPAVNGALYILKAAAKEPGKTVERVICCSSTASINEGQFELWKPDKVFTEEDWTVESGAGPYPVSKTRAERAVWQYVKENEGQLPFDVVVLNPGFILGPAPTESNSSSLLMFEKMLSRGMPAVPDLDFFSIDVRDVALAHLKAMLRKEAAGERIILVNGNYHMQAIAKDLAAELAPFGYSIPTGILPHWVMWLASWFDSGLNLLLPLLGKTCVLSNAKAKKLLEMEFLDLKRAAVQTAECMVALGNVKGAKPIPEAEGKVLHANWKSFAPAPAGASAEERAKYAFAMDDLAEVMWRG